VVFFIMVTTLFPLALSPEPSLLRSIAPGVVWVAALLASLLALETLFRADWDNGTLEQWALSGQPLAVLLLGKVSAHWCLTGVPLVLSAPIVAYALGMPWTALSVLMGALALGTAALSLLGAVGAALSLGTRRGSVLLSLMMLPMAMPVLIFGARATDLAMSQGVPDAGLWLLAALLIAAISLVPVALAAAVRISFE
jgi:heme exporter protein B